MFVGVTTNTTQNWKKEDGLNQLEKYLKLCEVLGCTPEGLFNCVESN
ncbi:MAG: hypothetical protein AAGE84_11780 [Cyanobacteria bacterium P01_G01_bin.39]